MDKQPLQTIGKNHTDGSEASVEVGGKVDDDGGETLAVAPTGLNLDEGQVVVSDSDRDRRNGGESGEAKSGICEEGGEGRHR